jgi:hypothetical protein
MHTLVPDALVRSGFVARMQMQFILAMVGSFAASAVATCLLLPWLGGPALTINDFSNMLINNAFIVAAVCILSFIFMR